jgi:transcriptional regulator with XRE-family HTH domain
MGKKDFQPDIYSKLRELRRSRGLTVHKLAEQISENHQKIGRIERGQRSLTIDYLMKVAKALQTPIDTLLNREQAHHEQKNNSPQLEQTTVSSLNAIVLFIENNQNRIPFCTPQKKGMLISKIYECVLQFPEAQHQLFLESLFKSYLLLMQES